MRSSVHDMGLFLTSGLRLAASAFSDGAMSDQPSNWVRTEPGVPVIRSVNWGGLKTLYLKEVRRFFKVQLQTIWAPAVTTLLFLVIFTVALGREGRSVALGIVSNSNGPANVDWLQAGHYEIDLAGKADQVPVHEHEIVGRGEGDEHRLAGERLHRQE